MTGEKTDMGICSFVKPLLLWWQRTGPRNYPWRSEKDTYRLLVAEVLLQRTRRDLVIEVYKALIEKYPTAKALASASEEEVKRIIASLGLAKRARYLVRMARELCEGVELEELTGVGKYTASMVRLLRGEDVELVPDASIARVFSRLTGLPLNNQKPANTPWVAKLLNECAPKDKKREFMLALIDLAWEICKPSNPLCHLCPLSEICRTSNARAKGAPLQP